MLALATVAVGSSTARPASTDAVLVVGDSLVREVAGRLPASFSITCTPFSIGPDTDWSRVDEA